METVTYATDNEDTTWNFLFIYLTEEYIYYSFVIRCKINMNLCLILLSNDVTQYVHSRARVFRDWNGFRSQNLLNCARARPESAIQKSILRLRSATEAREQNSATESRRQPSS